jgi:predicted metalloprotease with PDZ domain
MKQKLIILVFVLILTACSQENQINPSNEPNDITQTNVLLSHGATKTIENWTSTPTLTIFPSKTNTPTPTVTATPTVTPDLDALGKPEKPFASRWKKPAYSEKDYDIYQRIIHGRPITIAWEKSANIIGSKQKEISDFYFQTFITWWEIFQGFPYDSYTVVMKEKGNNAGETGVGYQETASDYLQTLDGHLKERITHEVLHAWVGNAVCVLDEQKYDDGLWFREGFTQYYGDRGAGNTGRMAYRDWMNEHYQIYKTKIMGSELDIPLFDMPAKGRQLGEQTSGNNRNYRLNVYWKGALVAYMIDERLIKNGFTLDDLLKYLYDKYALKQKCLTTHNAIQGLNAISGEDWNDFFKAYIYGNEALPLNGSFKFFNH